MKIIAVCLLLLVCFQSHASLLITPTRIAFDDRQRVTKVTLINNSDESKTYRMSFQEKLALKTGGYSNFANPKSNLMAASSYLRMSPKQVILGPGERQVVKLALRKRANMAEGEYRSHLLFSALPSASKKQASASSEGGIKINLIMSYSIPVLFRVGSEKPTVSLENVDLVNTEQGGQRIELVLNRLGKYSSFGRLEAFWQADGSVTAQLVSTLSKFSVYPELNQRAVALDIPKHLAIEPPGTLTIKYLGDEEYQGQTFINDTVKLSK
ncbi:MULTISPECIES: fimbrial biogenesis chaperone [unclassified Pseudoalteromonas]|uniref:fimbrial biogenesis chaperone n=1 Tax=unclassified Pseudoalteromonas TaxID=194690 RepID=UPI0030146AEA